MAPLLLALALAAGPGPRIIEDDFPRALAQAKAQRKLLFVDAWAPWCHTCVAMREQVLTRPAFKAFEAHVVFAAVDTEKEKSAAFLERYPVEVWPTLFFIEPSSGAVALKWLGSADEAQMQALLDAARGGQGVVTEADALLAGGRAAEAAARYQAAREGGAALTARSTLSLLSALYLAKQAAVCTRVAVEALPAVTAPADRVAILTWGLGCALDLPEGPQRAEALPALTKAGLAALSLEGVLPDDVSGLYEVLAQERLDAKAGVEAEALARRWLAFLEGAAAQAKTPAERAVFDPHRVSAALLAKTPEVMVAPLLASERALPRDYNPPARLALVYRELGRYPEGLAAIERALAKCTEGPRKLRLFETRASLQEKRGDLAGRRRTLAEAVAWAKKLPRAQVSAQRLAALEAQLAAAKE